VELVRPIIRNKNICRRLPGMLD